MAYNTAPFHGKTARGEKNDVAIDFTEGWTINTALDMADISRQGQHWKEGVPGQASWSGTLAALLVLGNTEQKALIDNLITATPGTKLTDLKFLLDGSTNAFSGNVYLTGVSISAPKGDSVKVTFSFVGDGALAVSDAA